jgi:hypothetical protein
MKIIFIFLLPNLFFLTYIPHYYPLTFQLISSPSGHHKFNFDYSLFFLKIKTHFMKGKKTNSTLNIAKFHRFINLAELPTGVAAWPLLSFLFVSGVLGLQIRRGQIRWKANTSGYNFYVGTLLEFCSFQVQNPPRKQGNKPALFC